jgi:RNA polymerase sigma-70 factor (ECF subfamily)
MDERLQIAAIKQGDARAFEALFRQFYESLCRYAQRLLGDSTMAEEAVQDVFLKFWERRMALEITTGLKPYLYRAVHNHCMNQLKHGKIKQIHREYVKSTAKDESNATMEYMESRELQVRIEHAVENLPEQCRRTFELSRFQQLSYQEIADVMGLSIKTVENQIGKALKQLRSSLADYLSFLPIMLIMKLFSVGMGVWAFLLVVIILTA